MRMKIHEILKNTRLVRSSFKSLARGASWMVGWICLGLFSLLIVSCTASSVKTGRQQKVLTGIDEPYHEEKVEANDMACSYFYFLWGKTAENNHRFDEALEAYEKALLCDEESEYISRNLAILLVKLNRKEQAAKLLEEIISRNHQDTENRILLAKLYASMGRHDEAVAIYQELLKIREDHDTLLMLGTLYAQNKEYDKAQNILNRLINLEGDSYLAHYYLARLYREMQYFDKAVIYYDKALELNWSERLALEIAEFYESRQDYENAIALYRRVLEDDDTNELIRTRLVNLYLSMDEKDKALAELWDLKNLLPESHSVDITISRILLTQEKYDETIDLLSETLQQFPELGAVNYLLGMAYYQKGDMENAGKQLRFIKPAANVYEDSILLQARILKDGKNLDGAVQLLEKELADGSTRKPSFIIFLASLYREKEEIDQGREVYAQGMELFPDNVSLLYSYGIFLEKIKEQEQAMAIMQQVLNLEPDNAAALNYVGYTWADKNVHLEKAYEYIRKAVDLMPQDGYIRDSLGWVYFKMGDTEQAIVELEKALEMVDSDPVIYEHLGDAYLHKGDEQKALVLYEKSYEQYEDEDKKTAVQVKIDALKTRGAR
jgi:tetratricopeptide (TPR) repeat protein